MQKSFLSFLSAVIFWAPVFGEPNDITEIECTIVPMRNKPRFRRPKEKSQPFTLRKVKTKPCSKIESQAVSTTSDVTSLNWSGYAALPPVNNSVSCIIGEWTVPALSPTTDNSYSSIWVGIDGFSDNTVEQIGTNQFWLDGFQINYAWFEMYPNDSVEIVGFPVNVNDNILASVQYVACNTFQLKITNLTQCVSTVIPCLYTISSAAQRGSAEWIVEAPYDNGILPLANFGTVDFTQCKTTILGHTGNIDDSDWNNAAITMITPNNVVKAAPSGLSDSQSGSSFSVTWESE